MNESTRSLKIPLIISLAVFATTALLVFPWTAPGLYWGDYPELATTATVMGVPHGPGYPTYTLMAGLFVQVLPCDATRAANLASWFWGAVVCGLATLVTALVLLRSKLPPGWLAFVSILWGLVQMVNLDVFSQSLVSEVYTLNLALLWLTFLVVIVYLETQDLRWAFLWAFITGIAAGNHLLGSLAAPGLFIAILWRTPHRLSRLPLLAVSFGLGLSVYLLLPVRSFAGTALNWGNTQGWEGFVWTVTNQGFMEGKFEFPLQQVLMALGLLGDLFWNRLGAVAIVLAALGLVWVWRSREFRPLWLALLFSFILMSVFVINNVAPAFEWTVLSIPTYVVLWLLALFGFKTIWEQWLSKLKLGKLFFGLIAIAAITLPVINQVPAMVRFNRSGNDTPDKLEAFDLSTLPHRAVLITMSSTEYFALQNRLLALHLRPDMDLAFGMLLRFEWARRQFREHAEDFATPSHFGVNVILDYCLIPQTSRSLFYQPTDGVIDKYFAVHLVPWGMFYKVGPFLSFKLDEFLTLHERMLAGAGNLVEARKDIFTPAWAHLSAESRAAYYLYLAQAGREALALKSADTSSVRQLESQLATEDPPLALEIAGKMRSQIQLGDWVRILEGCGDREMRRVGYFTELQQQGLGE